MKRKLLFILSMMITNFMMAQKSALLTDFRFIVNDTQEFPNFFENEDLTTDVLNIGLELIKKNCWLMILKRINCGKLSIVSHLLSEII